MKVPILGDWKQGLEASGAAYAGLPGFSVWSWHVMFTDIFFRQFCFPVAMRQISKNVCTANVMMDNRIWFHLMEITETSSYVKTDRLDVTWLKVLVFLKLTSEACSRQLHKNHHLPFNCCSNKLNQVGMVGSSSYAYFSLKQLITAYWTK